MQNKRVCSFISLFLCISTLQLQAQTGIPKNLTAAGMLADYNVLCKALEEAHGGLYRFSNTTEENNRFAAYRKKLNTTINKQQFISLVSEMLAELRDGHMRLEYDDSTNNALGKARLFPLGVLIEGSRLMVLFNDSRDDSIIRPGMEILSINEHKSADLIQSVLPKLPGDGFIQTGKMRRLERNFSQYYWLFVDPSMKYTITAKDANGKIIKTILTGVINAERENNRASNPVNAGIRMSMAKLEGGKENISLRFLNGPGLACIRVRSFEGDDFYSSIDAAFKTLYNKKTKALILDLRGNGGGVDEFGAYLVSQFMNKPFRYFDRIHLTTITPSFTAWKASTLEELRNGVVPDPKGGWLVTPKLHSGVGIQQPGKLPFTGKVFVLMDGGTFSTAADVTAMLRHLTKAIFIGEESGGGYEGNTSGLNALLKFPNSGLSLRIHLYEYFNAVSPRERGRGTLADYVVEKRMNDLLKGIDKQMQQAIELANTSLKN